MDYKRQKSTINDILRCPVCYESFSSVFTPMLIPCGHTICNNCVEFIIKNEKDADDDEYDEVENNQENSNDDLFSDSDDDDSSQTNSNDEENEDDEDDNDDEEESGDSNDETEEHGEECNGEEDSYDGLRVLDDFEDKEGKKQKNSKIKFMCSICRQKWKMHRDEIILNMQVDQLIKSKENLVHQKNKVVYCSACKQLDKELSHSQKYHSHSENFIFLNEFSLQSHTKLFEKLKEDEQRYQSLTKKVFEKIHEKKEEFAQYLFDKVKTMNDMLSTSSYTKNKIYQKLEELYKEFENHSAKKNTKELESILDKAKRILKDFENNLNGYINIIDFIIQNNYFGNHLNKKGVYEEYILDNLKYGFFDLIESNIYNDQRKFALGNTRESYILYDIRTKIYLFIKYNKVFGKTNYEKYASESVETDQDKLLYIVGKESDISKKFKVYNLETRKLTNKANIPIKMLGPRLIYKENHLYILGSYEANDDENINRCFKYSVSEDKWTEIASLIEKRRSYKTVCHNDTFYVIGGEDVGGSPVGFIEYWNYKSEPTEWKSLKFKNFNINLVDFLVFFFNDDLMLIVGGQVIPDFDDNEKGYIVNIKTEELVSTFSTKNNVINYGGQGSFQYNLIGHSSKNDDDGAVVEFDIGLNFAKLYDKIY